MFNLLMASVFVLLCSTDSLQQQQQQQQQQHQQQHQQQQQQLPFVTKKDHEYNEFRLTSPTHYVIYSGDFDVTYRTPESALHKSTRPVIVELHMDKEKPNSTILVSSFLATRSGYLLTVSCATIDLPGTYRFLLREEPHGPVRAESNTLLVTWPEVNLSPPHVTTSEPRGVITVSVEIDAKVACNDVTVTYTLDLLYYGADMTSQEVTSQSRVVYTRKLNKISPVKTRLTFTVSCDSGSIPEGVYRSRLSSSVDPMTFLVHSDPVWVNQTRMTYSLVTPKTAVMPCVTDFPVRYTRPSCFGSNRDVIRLYRKLYLIDRFPVSPPHVMQYVGEKRTGMGDEEDVRFSCELFEDVSDEEEFCIKYTKISLEGAASDKKSVCFKANGSPIEDVSWSSWQQWNQCSSASCGQAGNQLRYRFCNVPTQTPLGGRFCEGPVVERRPCDRILCPGDLQEFGDESLTNSSCTQCTCRLNATHLHSKTFLSPGHCSSSIKRWIIKSADDDVIRLNFDLDVTFRNQVSSKSELKVRDGLTRASDLLLHITSSDGDAPDQRSQRKSEIRTVKSSSNKILIELVSNRDEDDRNEDDRDEDDNRSNNIQFILEFYSENKTKKSFSHGLRPEDSNGFKIKESSPSSSLSNDVISSLGICVCILLALCILVFSWRHLSCGLKATNDVIISGGDNLWGRNYELELADPDQTTVDGTRHGIMPSETYSDAVCRGDRPKPISAFRNLQMDFLQATNNHPLEWNFPLRLIELDPHFLKFSLEEDV